MFIFNVQFWNINEWKLCVNENELQCCKWYLIFVNNKWAFVMNTFIKCLFVMNSNFVNIINNFLLK
jgi:hypothetical protein